ncbi:MAG: hypothetical protein ACM3VZ_08560 [Acidobacteriota bacterium]
MTRFNPNDVELPRQRPRIALPSEEYISWIDLQKLIRDAVEKIYSTAPLSGIDLICGMKPVTAAKGRKSYSYTQPLTPDQREHLTGLLRYLPLVHENMSQKEITDFELAYQSHRARRHGLVPSIRHPDNPQKLKSIYNDCDLIQRVIRYELAIGSLTGFTLNEFGETNPTKDLSQSTFLYSKNLQKLLLEYRLCTHSLPEDEATEIPPTPISSAAFKLIASKADMKTTGFTETSENTVATEITESNETECDRSSSETKPKSFKIREEHLQFATRREDMYRPLVKASLCGLVYKPSIKDVWYRAIYLVRNDIRFSHLEVDAENNCIVQKQIGSSNKSRINARFLNRSRTGDRMRMILDEAASMSPLSTDLRDHGHPPRNNRHDHSKPSK